MEVGLFMEWNDYWNSLIKKYRLSETIKQLDIADAASGRGKGYTENTCKNVREDFLKNERHYSSVKDNFLKIIDSIPNVHSIGNRVKAIDSLLVKIVSKRAEKYKAKSSYVNITGDNYSDIITDLIGIRLVLHYQGQWREIHEQLIKLFPENNCQDGVLLPHRQNEQFMAEPPIAYHAKGDDVTQFNGIIKAKLHEKGYRSNHYIISFQDVYIELQVRTIYDEAWSDYDHTYVYKKEANPNNDALVVLSPILCKITNVASDIGELMRMIYEDSFATNESGSFVLDKTSYEKLEKLKDRFKEAEQDFKKFCFDHISSS